MKILGNRILVRVVKREAKTKSGLVLPQVKSRSGRPASGGISEGIVVEAGPGEMMENGKRRAMEVNKGDNILFADKLAYPVVVEQEDFVLIEDYHVLVVL